MNSGLPSAAAASRSAYSPSTRPARSCVARCSASRSGSGSRAQRRRRDETAAPRRPVGEQLRARERDEQHGHVLRPHGQHLDQVEQARVGPVDVLEHEQRRPVARNALHELARHEEERLAVDFAIDLEAEQQRQVLDRLGLRLDRARELLPRDLGRVAVEDARHLLHVLGEGAVGGALAVRDRAPAQRQAALRVDGARELLGETALADAGRPDHRHEVGPALVADLIPETAEQIELALAPHERSAGKRPFARGRRSPESEPDLDRLRLSLRDHRRGGRVRDRRARRRMRLAPDEHAVDRRRRLETRGRVDDVADDHRLAVLGTGVEVDDRLAGVDREASLEVELLVGVVHQLELVADRERGANGPLGVVAVRDRRAEDAEHRVADELLDPAAVPLDLRPNPLVVRRQERRARPPGRAAPPGT